MPATIIDDTSPDILYTGQWILGGADQEYNHTSHGSLEEGSAAIMSFSGRSIEVYGTIGEHNSDALAYVSNATFTIDGNSASVSTLSLTSQPGTEIIYNQLLYRSPVLDHSQHQLVITSNMNGLWIDYLQVDSPNPWIGTRRAEPRRQVKPALIAGAVTGGIVGLLLLIAIVIFLRRRSKLRKIQYEKVPWKPIQAYWPWSRPPEELTAFESDPYGETQPLGSLRPFSLQSGQYPPQHRPTSHSSEPGSGTSLGGSTIGDSIVTGKASSRSSRDPRGTGISSISGYTVQGSTWADKVPSLTSGSASGSTGQVSNATGYTSASGYTVQGGTWADKITSSPTEIILPTNTNRPENNGYTSQSGYTVQGGTHRDKTDRRSQAPGSGATPRITGTGSTRGGDPGSSNGRGFAPRPFISALTTNRRAVEGEEALPAYSNRHSILR